MHIIFCLLAGYLIGNLNPAYLLGRARGVDVRKDGSGNAGASNAFILVGAKAFVFSAVIDILKAFFAWHLCSAIFPDAQTAGPLGGVGCIIGHMYPVVLRFQGGRGLASLGGVVLAWSWRWFLVLLGLAILIALITRYVCTVAPAISILFPAIYYVQTGLLLCTLILLIPALPIFLKHLTNFRRILNGTEMRISFLWNKEEELKRLGRWNPETRSQLEQRNKG
ncbi:MAG: glycerol-3-phosphate acyltransferase [Clostridia bacterium]|nr:glycerol-3-phosphate acyltransferase [Clostridia bacterium]